MSSSDAATAATLLGVGVRTRAQKRRRGDERDSSLWDVVVKCDDITFTHILPRLNATDVKFLHGVNSETRKLIKRSSRKKELKEKFKVEEMSSISTLEVAWEHFPWEAYDYDAEEEMDETYFCWKVAQTNKLELLKWAREEKKCGWDVGTITAAARQGNLEMVKYCVANECPIDVSACAYAAENGHLECLKYLHEEAEAPWDEMTLHGAKHYSKRIDCLNYAIEQKCPGYRRYVDESSSSRKRKAISSRS